MRNTAFLALGLALIIAQSNLFWVLGWVPIAGIRPSLVLPLIVFMGVHEYSLTRGALLSFAVGYLLDVFASAPIGLYTFGCVSIFVMSRVAGVRLAAQTVLTKMALAFVFSLLESAIIIILTAILGEDPARAEALLRLVLPHALSTALCAPLVFSAARRVHEATISVPRPKEASGR